MNAFPPNSPPIHTSRASKHKHKRRLPLIRLMLALLVVWLIAVMMYQTYKPLPVGVSYESPLYTVDHVNFYYDLTYPAPGSGDRFTQKRHIYDRILQMVDEANHFIVIDMFLFNNYVHKGQQYPPLSEGLANRLIQRKQKQPDLQIVFITDEVNTNYNSSPNPLLEKMSQAGINIIMTDVDPLRDSTPLYSAVWRTFFQWFGQAGEGTIPNAMATSGPDVTIRSYLKLINVKANHRKAVITDRSALVSTGNVHDASAYHSNVAFEVQGAIIGDLLKAEQAVVDLSGYSLKLPTYTATASNTADSDSATSHTATVNTPAVNEPTMHATTDDVEASNNDAAAASTEQTYTASLHTEQTAQQQENSDNYDSASTANHDSVSTVNHDSASTANHDSASTANHDSASTANHDSASTANHDSASTANHDSTSTANYDSASTANYDSTSTANYDSTSTANYDSASTANYDSASTANYDSASTANYDSASTADYDSASAANYDSASIANYDSTNTASTIATEEAHASGTGTGTATSTITANPTTPADNTAPATGSDRIQIRYLTEGKVYNRVLEAIGNTQKGDTLWMGMFYLADRQVTSQLLAAAERGVTIHLILDPNQNAFGQDKIGIPNRPVAAELNDKSNGRIGIRWYNTTDEQYHTKLMYIHKPSGKDLIIGGSSNFTPRNLKDYNLENDLWMSASNQNPLMVQVNSYFNMLWNNDGEQYTMPLSMYQEQTTWLKDIAYRLQLILGFTTF